MSADLAVSMSQTYKNCSSQFRICLIEGYMAVLLILNQSLSKPHITVMIKTIGASPNFHHLSKFSKPRVKNPRFEVYLHNHATLDHFNELMY